MKLKISATDCTCTIACKASFKRSLAAIDQVDKNYRFVRITSISHTFTQAQLIFRCVVKKVWVFFGPWGGDRSHPAAPCWKTCYSPVKRVQQPTTHTFGVCKEYVILNSLVCVCHVCCCPRLTCVGALLLCLNFLYAYN